jgi:predicted nucleic acid-binding protein
MSIEPKIFMDAESIIDTMKYHRFQEVPRKTGVKLEDAPYFIQDFQYKQQHIEYCAKLLKAAEYRHLTLLTSTLSVAEVWHLGKSRKNPQPPSEEDKRIISSVLTSGVIFKLVSDSYFIAEKARDLCWKYEMELTGGDAIQVASALESNCIEFITNDKGILKNNAKLMKLGLKVINGQNTSALPANFYHPLLDSAETDEVLEASEISEIEGE